MKLWNQSVLAVSSFGFIIGASQFWPSPVLPQLRGEIPGVSHFLEPITTLQASKIASYLNLGSMFGPILAILLNDRIGRRKISLLCSIILTITYVVSAFAQTVETLYVTRFIIGIINGCLLVVAPIYASEIAENCNRGAVISFVSVMYNVGALVCLSIGPFVSVRVITLICGFPMFISSISFAFFTVESPYYLLAKTQENKARKSIIKLGKRGELEELMLELQTFVNNNSTTKISFKLLFSKASFKALYLSVGVHLVQKFSGFSAMSAYMQTIFIASGSSIPSQTCSIIIGFVQLVSIAISTRFVDNFGKKPLFLLSTSGCGMSLLILGVYFYLHDYNYNTSNIYWLPLSCLVLYMIAFKLALAGLPRVIMAEVFPVNVKSLGTTITIVIYQITAFLIALYFPIISQKTSLAYSFWFFAVCCTLSFVFILYVLPETKGKSLKEIQAILNGTTTPQTV